MTMIFLNYTYFELNDKIIHFPDCFALKYDSLKSLGCRATESDLTSEFEGSLRVEQLKRQQDIDFRWLW